MYCRHMTPCIDTTIFFVVSEEPAASSFMLQYFSRKRRYIYTKLHGVTNQTKVVLMGSDIRTSKVISKDSNSMTSTGDISIFNKLEVVKLHLLCVCEWAW